MIKRLYETVSAPIKEAKDRRILNKITDEVLAVTEACPYNETTTAEENERRLDEIELGICRAKLRWEEDHPQRLEEAELLFGLPHFFRCARQHQKDRAAGLPLPIVEENLRDIAEFNVTLTHFLTENADDHAYLRSFWRSAKKIALEGHTTSPETLEGIVNGWLGQVAAFRILKEMGLDPHHPTPNEDYWEATDLYCRLPWQKKPTRVQIKAEERRKNVSFLPFGADEKNLLSLGRREQASIRPITRPRVRMIELRLPTGAIDPNTAIPKKEVIDQCRKKFEELKEVLRVSAAEEED